MASITLIAAFLPASTAVMLSAHITHFDVRLDRTNKADGAAAVAIYESEEGWGKLWVKAFSTVKAEEAIFAAGFLEGYLTRQAIEDAYSNCYGDWFLDGAPKDVNATAIFEFLEQNLNFVLQRSAEPPSRFWTYVPLLISQLRGLGAGLQAAGSSLGFREMLFLNADGDLEELVPMLGRPRLPHRDRCSALIKLLPDNSEILMGHTTWDHYSMMVRSLKTYDFQLRGWPQSKVSFSASPGFLTSLDDFYLVSSGLAVIETTNGFKNKSLYSLISPSSVLFWMRVLVANALATNAQEWIDLFVTEQSGTYNNQWMLIDMKLFEPGQQLKPTTFMVLETMPGMAMHADMTHHLESEGYWASFNVPFFEEIYRYAGNALPNIHDTCPRARIFRQQQARVHNIDTFKRVLRYNDWQHDSLSLDNACNAVASRCDLNNISDAQWQLDGAIDAKVTSVAMAKQLFFQAQQGPTYDEQVPFSWSDVPPDRWSSHNGQPDTFTFAWIDFGPLPDEGLELGTAALQQPLVVVACAGISLLGICMVLSARMKADKSWLAAPLLPSSILG